MATVKVDYNKTTGEYFAHCGGHYIKSETYGKVAQLVQRNGDKPKATYRAQKAHQASIN